MSLKKLVLIQVNYSRARKLIWTWILCLFGVLFPPSVWVVFRRLQTSLAGNKADCSQINQSFALTFQCFGARRWNSTIRKQTDFEAVQCCGLLTLFCFCKRQLLLLAPTMQHSCHRDKPSASMRRREAENTGQSQRWDEVNWRTTSISPLWAENNLNGKSEAGGGKEEIHESTLLTVGKCRIINREV